MNTKPLELSNVTKWHSAGYTGKGVTIVIIDSAGKPRDYMRDYYVDIFEDQTESGHGANVGYVAHLYAPDARIIFLDKRYRDRNYDWLADNKDKVDLINFSQAGVGGISTPEYDKYKTLNIPMICGAGNDYFENKISAPARYDWTIAIGAYHWRQEGAFRNQVPAYSNKGAELDAVAFAEYYMYDNGRSWLVDGTSYAAPTASGLLACYIQYAKERDLSVDTESLRKFIHENCIDIYEKGFDTISGHGLFVLPESIPKIEKPKKEENKPVSNPIEFKDTRGHWAESAIKHVAERGLMVGRTKDTFAPNEPITRAEMAVILYRLSEDK